MSAIDWGVSPSNEGGYIRDLVIVFIEAMLAFAVSEVLLK